MSCCDVRFDAGVERGRNDGPPDARAARRKFFGVIGLVFIAGASATIAMSRSMSAMPDIPMPGDWTLSAMWIPASTCGGTWLGAVAAFVAMWTVMMIPMMLPSLTPALWTHWQHARGAGARRAAWSTLSVGIGYFLAWALLGAVAFALGASLSAALLRSTVLARSMPVFSSVVIVLAGCVQLTRWKARSLASCRPLRRDGLAPANRRRAGFEHGFRLAVHGGACCANWMAVLFCFGLMDTFAMVSVSAAMLVEQFVPLIGRSTKGIGFVAITVGMVLVGHTLILR